MSGSVTLSSEEQGTHALSEGDAFVVPPGLPTSLTGCSEDFEFLEVTLPGEI